MRLALIKARTDTLYFFAMEYSVSPFLTVTEVVFVSAYLGIEVKKLLIELIRGTLYDVQDILGVTNRQSNVIFTAIFMVCLIFIFPQYVLVYLLVMLFIFLVSRVLSLNLPYVK